MTKRSTNGTRHSILDWIGDTPLLQLDGVWAKLEYLNPSGSIKARIAKHMIERAEAEGHLRPGDTIVEATSGNTGNALAMVAAVKGYRMRVIMPRGMSNERLRISRAFGAEVEMVGDFHVNAALERAKALSEMPGFFCPMQFESEWNVEENQLWLGPEILRGLPEGVAPDCLVMGVGTGGTIVGVGRAFRERNPQVEIIAVEPQESATIRCGKVGRHRIEGISDGFVPRIFEDARGEIDDVISVSSRDAIQEMKALARSHGLLVGPSSGANLRAARRVRSQRSDLATIVTVLCDEGEKYLSEHFGDRDDSAASIQPDNF